MLKCRSESAAAKNSVHSREGIGQWLLFLSWIASRHWIDANEATRQWGMNLPSVAKAGFPISALELPPSPMGNDNVPIDKTSLQQYVQFLKRRVPPKYL